MIQWPSSSNGGDGVLAPDRKIPDDDKLHILRGHTCRFKCDVFGDGVVLAITEAGGKRGQWSTPAIDHTPLSKIAHWAYRKIDRAIDDPDAGATGLRLTLLNDC